MRHRPLPSILLLILFGAVSPAQGVDYLSDVKPILQEKCYSCHGVLKQESGLRLETRSLMLDGSVITPGDPSQSELLARIVSKGDDRMPPPHDGTPLKADQIRTIERWIVQGAPAPNEPVPVSPEQHWAFVSPRRPSMNQQPTATASLQNPIDQILWRRRNDLGTKVVAASLRSLSIRRLYLDLIGLPPTRQQLADRREWTVIVDELLANPAHGERWARHWMDVWRYSDWYGLNKQIRYSQKHMWHWRDWIIKALNDDKPYDRMLMEMVAGDEISPSDPEVVAATGFLARNYYLFNRTTWLDHTIEHTGKAFLGLTLNCAKCHDHKYDPITQVDYYRYRAIFEPHQVRLDPVRGRTEFESDGLPRVFDDAIDRQTYLHLKGDPQSPDKEQEISPGVPAIFADFEVEIQPLDLPLDAYAPGVRKSVQDSAVAAADAAIRKAEQEYAGLVGSNGTESDHEQKTFVAEEKLALEMAKLAATKSTINADNARYRNETPADVLKSIIFKAAESQANVAIAEAEYDIAAAGDDPKKLKSAKETHAKAIAQREKLNMENATYQSLRGSKKALESPAHKESDYPAVYSKISTGRRTALARWLTSKRNPLTARVAVNQVWMRHFGEPLVDSVFDFGLRAPPPANQPLLDFLAVEFMESGWSFKHLHRLIVTSETYRLASSVKRSTAKSQMVDPDNSTYWHFPVKRMESQVVRDSLLKLAGQLDASIGGPSLAPGPKHRRRSVYLKHSRDQQDKFLAMFDDADILQCYRRSESIVPQQALAMSNSQLAIEMSTEIARRISMDEGNSARVKFIDAAFETILCRPPDSEERQMCESFLVQLSDRFYDANTSEQGHVVQGNLQAAPELGHRDLRARARLVNALLNHNDFITIR